MNTQNVPRLFHGERFTTDEVSAQLVRFNTFMQSANIDKIGTTYVKLTVLAAENGEWFAPYNFIRRILSMLAGVNGSMYHPTANVFYADLLKYTAITKYFENLKK